jgi:hypothetical protein
MKSFVLELTGVNMLLSDSIVHTHQSYAGYSIQEIGKGEATQYKVLNGKGKQASKVLWQTLDGAAACAELLAGGYFKES